MLFEMLQALSRSLVSKVDSIYPLTLSPLLGLVLLFVDLSLVNLDVRPFRP